MQDGRYLIFYTFAERDAAAVTGEMDAAENPAGVAKTNEPLAKPEAEEERSV